MIVDDKINQQLKAVTGFVVVESSSKYALLWTCEPTLKTGNAIQTIEVAEKILNAEFKSFCPTNNGAIVMVFKWNNEEVK